MNNIYVRKMNIKQVTHMVKKNLVVNKKNPLILKINSLVSCSKNIQRYRFKTSDILQQYKIKQRTH